MAIVNDDRDRMPDETRLKELKAFTAGQRADVRSASQAVLNKAMDALELNEQLLAEALRYKRQRDQALTSLNRILSEIEDQQKLPRSFHNSESLGRLVVRIQGIAEGSS